MINKRCTRAVSVDVYKLTTNVAGELRAVGRTGTREACSMVGARTTILTRIRLTHVGR